MRFYKRDPKAFRTGVSGLTMEEVGVYTMLLDFMYENGQAIPDTPAAVCLMLNGLDPRVWKRVRASLIAKGKIFDNGNGCLSNVRVEKELVSFAATSERRKSAGSTGGQVTQSKVRKALKTLDVEQASAQASAQAPAQADIDKIEDTSLHSVSSSSSLRSDESQRCGDETNIISIRPVPPITDAIEAYNRVAQAQGWRRCREITKARRTTISARLRQRGMDGWMAALAIAQRTRWINDPESRPNNHRTWKPNIDWFVRDKTFVDLFESEDAAGMPELETVDVWKMRLEYLGKFGKWESRRWGPAPGEAGCRVPAELLIPSAERK